MTHSLTTTGAFFAIVVACSLFSTSAAHAQLGDFKLAAASYEYYPNARATQNALNPEGNDVAFQSFKAQLTVPITIAKDRTIFIPGFRYYALDIIPDDGTSQDAPAAQVDALHALMLKAGLWHRFTESWAVFASVSAGVASDFGGELSTDDLVFAGHLIALWTLLPEFTIGAGIGYDRRTGELAPLPLVALDWQPSDRFMVRGVVPELLAIRWCAIQWLTLGLEGALEGERYHLDDSDLEDMEVEVAYSIIKAGAAATVHCAARIHTRVYGGIAASRRFEILVDDVSQGDLEVATRPYLGIELVFGPSGWKSDSRE
jgi:hypothetical protein